MWLGLLFASQLVFEVITMINHIKSTTRKLALTAFCLGLLPMGLPLSAQADAVTVKTTTIFACGRLFEIQANADGMTAAERAVIVQKNLDNALIAAHDRSPKAVRVSIMNRNPVVSLDNFYVVTADGNSAARANMTQMELAEKWADSLRVCLSDKVSLQSYMSMLTGKFEAKTKLALGNREDIAVAPFGMTLPIQLSCSVHADTAKLGDSIEAVVRTDVPFGPGFTTYLPAGTQALGELVYARDYVPNNYGGKHALTPWFHSLRTPDGKEIPIDAYIVGDINFWKNIKTEPSQAICSESSEGFVETMRQENLPDHAVPGEVVGGWRGYPVGASNSLGFSGEPGYRTSNLQYNGLIVPNHSLATIPSGTKMLLQLASTTTISVNSQGRRAM
jgi:hypothetical protein